MAAVLDVFRKDGRSFRCIVEGSHPVGRHGEVAAGARAQRDAVALAWLMTVLYDQITVVYDQMTVLLTALQHSRKFDFE